MSEVRVALVAEGPTDLVIIEAALRALLSKPFTLTLLQPEPTRPRFGGGWCGVLKWCREVAARGTISLETDPTLASGGFELFVIHTDADVAEASYSDGGAAVASAAQGLPALPCSKPCPPPEDSANEIRARLLAWLGMTTVGQKTVLCVPSKASEAWLAAALFADSHELLQELECNLKVEARLATLPMATRIKKKTREYQAKKAQITSAWGKVRRRCTQAERFSTEVENACP